MFKPRFISTLSSLRALSARSLVGEQRRCYAKLFYIQRCISNQNNMLSFNAGSRKIFNLIQRREFCSKEAAEQKIEEVKAQYEEPEVPDEAMEDLKKQITRISQCMNLGMYKDAKTMLEKYKVDLSKYYKPDHPAYCSYENNMGVLLRLNGQFEEAYDILHTAYLKYVKLFGKEHDSTLSCVVNLATVLRDLKDYKQSILYYEEAKEIRKKMSGEESPNYAVILGMSAGAYRLSGDIETAYKYLKQAYVIMANYYKGEECTPCAVILNSMGMLYKQEQKFERAADAYERCLKIREKLVGKSHPDTISVRHNLGELYLAWDKPDKAKEYHDENLKLMQEVQEKQRQLNKDSQNSHGHTHSHSHSHSHAPGEKCNDPTHKH